MKHAAPTPGKYREAARYALFFSSNWIAVLTVTYAVLLIPFTAVFFTDSVLSVLRMYTPIPEAVDMLLYIVWFLLLSPLSVGLLYYYTDLFRAAHGDGRSHVPPAVIFSPYASLLSVVRAWGQVFMTLLLCALIPLSLLPLYMACTSILQAHAVMPAILLLLGGIVLFLCVLYLNARLTPVLFLSSVHPELSFGDAVRRTWKTARTTAVTGVLLQLGLLAAGVCSLVLTAGIVFFIYVLPVAVFTYIGYCHDLSRRCDLL